MSLLSNLLNAIKPDFSLTEMPTMSPVGVLDELPIEQWEKENEEE